MIVYVFFLPARPLAGLYPENDVSSGKLANEVNLTRSITCIAPMALPTEHRCYLTQRVRAFIEDNLVYKFNLEGLTLRKLVERVKFRLAIRASPCGTVEAFPPLQRTHGYDYYVCTHLLRHWEREPGRDNIKRFMVFAPKDDQDKIAECDVYPFLMAIATTGQGLALDIGAGMTGDCSFPLLSQGHRVHMFESGYSSDGVMTREADFVGMTLDVNGWRDRATLHGEVTKDNIERHFLGEARIDLVKVDVDVNVSYEAVFEGIAPIRQKTEIIVVELITDEIGLNNKFHALSRFEQHGFDSFSLTDTESFSGNPHGCLSVDDNNQAHYQDVIDNKRDYVYGENGPKHIRMSPLCTCTGAPCRTDVCLFSSGKDAGIKLLETSVHFAFVRRASSTMQRVAAKYGSCDQVCARVEGQNQLGCVALNNI